MEEGNLSVHKVAPMKDWNTLDDSIVLFQPVPGVTAKGEKTEVVMHILTYDQKGQPMLVEVIIITRTTP